MVGVLADDHHADDLEASHVQLLDALLDDLAELQTAATHHARIVILVREILFQHFGDDFPDLLDEKQEDVRLDWIIIIILFLYNIVIRILPSLTMLDTYSEVAHQ